MRRLDQIRKIGRVGLLSFLAAARINVAALSKRLGTQKAHQTQNSPDSQSGAA
jgi:hypothetical protein